MILLNINYIKLQLQQSGAVYVLHSDSKNNNCSENMCQTEIMVLHSEIDARFIF